MGHGHGCAIRQGGDVLCWGANFSGQLGDGTRVDRPTPVAAGASGVVQLSLGYQHSCAVDAGGDVWCWGGNAAGQIDATLPADVLDPTVVFRGAASVTAGHVFTCVVDREGAVHCRGANDRGQLGNGSFAPTTETVVHRLCGS
jgi:alpha-tubulin suppressor-like RCC1 family protein